MTRRIEENDEGPEKVIINVNFESLQSSKNSHHSKGNERKIDEFKFEDLKAAKPSDK